MSSHGRWPLRLAAAAVVAATVVLGAQTPGEPPPTFGTIGEGLTSQRAGGTMRAGFRMFTVPDLPGLCARARAGDVARLHAASPVALRVGRPFELRTLRIDAFDAAGALLPGVPVLIEAEHGSAVLDTRTDRIADGRITAVRDGIVRLRMRTACEDAAAETFLTLDARR